MAGGRRKSHKFSRPVGGRRAGGRGRAQLGRLTPPTPPLSNHKEWRYSSAQKKEAHNSCVIDLLLHRRAPLGGLVSWLEPKGTEEVVGQSCQTEDMFSR